MASNQYDSLISITYSDQSEYTTSASRIPKSFSFDAVSKNILLTYGSLDDGTNDTIAYSMITFNDGSTYESSAATGGEEPTLDFEYVASGSIVVSGTVEADFNPNVNSSYFVSLWKTDNTGSTLDNQIRFPLTAGTHNFIIDWGDGTS